MLPKNPSGNSHTNTELPAMHQHRLEFKTNNPKIQNRTLTPTSETERRNPIGFRGPNNGRTTKGLIYTGVS